VETCSELLATPDNVLSRIITGDETWIYNGFRHGTGVDAVETRRLFSSRGAENDGHENDGPSKLKGMKLQDMKLQDVK